MPTEPGPDRGTVGLPEGSANHLSEWLRSIFAGEGLLLFGCADTRPDRENERHYEQWISAGYHGAMSYLERHGAGKFHAERALAGCRSVLSVGLCYHQDDPWAAENTASPVEGRIARYAWRRDYHRVLGDKLDRIAERLLEAFPDEHFAAFTDSTALAEKHYAERAGLGHRGYHTLLINEAFGSWFVIGEILSTRKFPEIVPARASIGSLHCETNCGKCLAACPTGALIAPYVLDARRCIAYLTVEYRGIIPLDLRPRIGDWLFGCDLCQEACPVNRDVTPRVSREFGRLIAGPRQRLDSILRIACDEEVREKLPGSPLVRAQRGGLVRNACIVAANTRAADLLHLVERLCFDSDPIVAEHARWAADTIGDN